MRLRRLILVFVGLGSLAISVVANAIALPPGATDVVPNALSGGDGEALALFPHEYDTGTGIQYRVVQLLSTQTTAPTGAPLLPYQVAIRIINSPFSTRAITQASFSGLATATMLDVSYDPPAPTPFMPMPVHQPPSTASRSADGDTVTFTFEGADEIAANLEIDDIRLRFDAVSPPASVLLLLTINRITVPVDIVFEQPAGANPGSSFISATTTGSDGFRTYESFSVPTDLGIGFVRWRGLYVDTTGINPTTPNTTSWEFSFFDDSEGEPGVQLFTQSLLANEVDVTTIGDVELGRPPAVITATVLEFDATLPTMFPAAVDQRYWVSIRSFAPSLLSPFFSWNQGQGLDLMSVQDELVPFQRFVQPFSGDRVLSLGVTAPVPEPSASALGVAAFASLLALARRKRNH